MRGKEGEGMGTVSIQYLNELFTRIELFNYIQMSTQQGGRLHQDPLCTRTTWIPDFLADKAPRLQPAATAGGCHFQNGRLHWSKNEGFAVFAV